MQYSVSKAPMVDVLPGLLMSGLIRSQDIQSRKLRSVVATVEDRTVVVEPR